MTIDSSPDAFRDDAYLSLTLGWQRALLGIWMLAQQNQFENLTAWQKAIAAFNQDLFDRWVCRFGGGVPLDG